MREGHGERECQDVWRRFHLTTSPDIPPVTPPGEKSASKSFRDCWCPNCGLKGHTMDNCRRHCHSQYPVFTPRVLSYKQPHTFQPAQENEDDHNENEVVLNQSDLANCNKNRRRERKQMVKDRKRKEKILRLNNTCPSSPCPDSPRPFLSEPPSPIRLDSFPTTILLNKAVEKVDKKKKKNKKFDGGIVEKDFLSISMPNLKPSKKLKQNENRVHEFREVRGFGKKVEGQPASVGIDYNTIPINTRAACKMLKKELGKVNSVKGRKNLHKEIFGLKNLQGSPCLKKKERRRLAFLVHQARASG